MRAWLRKNHARLSGVWLVTNKKESGRPFLPYDDIVEELICFGWIDSLPRTLSATQSMLYIAPRKKSSAWSRLNKQRAEKMIAAKKMTPQGMALIETAKQNGKWDFLNEVESLTIPKDLAALFAKNKTAANYFDAFPPSVKRAILEWIAQAKQPETRAKRISETVQQAMVNIRANHPRQPKSGGIKS